MGEQESRSMESDNQNKITHGKYIRGVVPCKDCMKPRYLYSFTSPNKMKPNPVDGAIEPTGDAIRMCREYGVQQFESVQDNELYVCGMQHFDADELMYGVIVTRDGLECHI